MRRRAILGAFLAVVISAVGATAVLSGEGAAFRSDAVAKAPKIAPASLFVAPSGSDRSRCLQAAPCASFNRAYRVAQPGQVVAVAPGTYPPQRLDPDASKTSFADVVFRASGAVTLEGQLKVYGSHVEFQNMAVSSWEAVDADDVTFRNMDVGAFWITSANNVSVIGGDAGPYVDADPHIQAWPLWEGREPRNILIDGVRFHDFTLSDPEAHVECLQVMTVVGLVIRNSRFERCWHTDIIVSPYGGPVRNVTIENNWFGQTMAGSYSLHLGAGTITCDNFGIRNNTALQNMYSDCTPGGSNGIRFRSNIQPSMSSGLCSVSFGAVWNWNVYESGVRCGARDRVGRVSFVDRAAFDLHLKPGSAAIDRGDPEGHPLRDIDGERRPAGGAPDAGADETPDQRRTGKSRSKSTSSTT
jgi:hypothetical protein